MDDIQRFDEFEWLLANKVVKENVLPDENVLVSSGHSAISIGLTELYFVELFYDIYVRVFGSAFIQNKIDVLKNETARKWANYGSLAKTCGLSNTIRRIFCTFIR